VARQAKTLRFLLSLPPTFFFFLFKKNVGGRGKEIMSCPAAWSRVVKESSAGQNLFSFWFANRRASFPLGHVGWPTKQPRERKILWRSRCFSFKPWLVLGQPPGHLFAIGCNFLCAFFFFLFFLKEKQRHKGKLPMAKRAWPTPSKLRNTQRPIIKNP